MNRYAFTFSLSCALLFALGLIMVFNTTAAEVLDRALDRSTHHALIKQILYAGLGALGAFGLWILGYEAILKLSGFFLGFFTLLLILVFVPKIGQQINGAHRWLSIFGHSFQPSEFVKYLIPIYYIHAITSRKEAMRMKDFILLLGIVAVPMSLILIEPDNGTVAIIFSALLVLFILTRIRFLFWGLPLCILLVAGVAIASRMPHVSDRIKIYLHPELDLRGKGHQPYQAKIAAGSGGFFGKGLGESLQKLDYLPEARSDYIAAIFAEEFGFLGICGMLLLYMTIGFCGFKMALLAPTSAASLLIAILTYLICFQAFLNLGVVSGLLPSKGTNLPFFSQGGSSLLANFMVVSIILNTARKRSEHRSAKT
jgi:cell division protein FtsW